MRKVFLIIAVVLMVLVALAIAAFFGARSVVSKVVGNGDDSSVFNYSSPSSYSVGDAEIKDDISSLTINWLSGEVRVEEYEGSRVVIKDEVTEGKISDDLKLRWKKEGGKVTIQYAAGGIRLNLKGFSKNLVVYVPSFLSLKELKIDGVSADGIISLSSLGKLEWDSVNGGMDGVFSRLDEVECDGVNGDIDLTVKERIPIDMDIDGVNNNVKLTVPSSSSFTLTHEAINGDFQSEIPGTMKNKNTFIAGSGKAEWKVEGVNGDVEIRSL